MSLEESLVGCHVLDGYDVVGTRLYDLVDQLHRVAVRKEFADTVNIHQRRVVRIIVWRLNFMCANFAAHLAGKLVVDGVSRTSGNDASLDGATDKRHVTDDVKKFVAGRLVAPNKWLVVEVSQLRCILVLNFHIVGQLIETFLRNLLFINHDGIVEVSALYQTGFQQGLDFTDKHECAG